MPKAHLSLRNLATSQEQKSESGNTGSATFPFLKPGHYQLTVSKDAFADIVVDNITLNVGDDRRLQLSLKIGATTETVTVDGSGLTINTTDASVSTVVDRKFVENMPLNGRSLQNLILLTPGVVSNNPQTAGTSGSSGEFSVNGQRTEANAYYVDGVSANTGGYVYGLGTAGTSGSLPAATALGTTQSLISVDALQEFRVSTSTYSAEYGLSPGGQFSFATRSGTNQLHGSAFDYLRNNYFDANDWFNNNLGKPATALRQNDFGGTFGGPVWFPKVYDRRNKSFFFFSYEGLRLTQPQAAVTYYVPSPALRQSAPLALQTVLNSFPVATGTALSNGLAPFVQSNSNPSKIDSTSIRFDQQITSRMKAFYRFGHTQSATQTRLLSVLTNTSQSSYVNTFGITANLSEHIIDDFRIGYTSNLGNRLASIDNFGGAIAVDLAKLQGFDPSPNAYAVVGLNFPGYSPQVSQGGTTQPQHSWDLVNGLTAESGRQLIKLGVSYRTTASRLQVQNPFAASYFNSSQAVVANTSYLSYVYNYGRSYPAYTNTGLYLQDEVRVNQRLGLSLGIRWEVNPPPTQTTGMLPYILQGNIANPPSLSLAPSGTRFWKTTYHNFAPRLGVSYQAHNGAGRETVIRAGGGVFFDTGQQNSTQAFGNSPGQSATKSYSNVSYPLTPTQLAVPLVDPPTPPYLYAFYFPKNLQLPYTLQWNVSLQQAFGNQQAVTVSYVGSNGRRLLSYQILAPGVANSNFTNIYSEKSGTTSNYNGLQIQFQRQLSRGLQVLASYGWTHSIDFGSQNKDYPYVRGNSDYDVRHSVNAAVGYEIHSVSSNSLARTLIDQWGVDGRFSARTAFPLILNGNSVFQPNGQYGYTGLNLVPQTPIYLHIQGLPGNRRINPAAFALPVIGQNGNAPRNFVRGFGTNQIDLAVRRAFPITERMNLQFRAEAFNLLNRPNFGYIQSVYGNAQFGQAAKMLNQSLGNISPLYQQGGPRSMQFALKFVF